VVLTASAGCATTHTNTVGNPGAAAAVCTSRNDLSTAIQQLETNVKAANFGAARDNLNQARTAATNLKTAAGNLVSEQRQKIQPQLDQIQSDLSSLTSVSGLAHLATTALSIQTQLDSALNTIRSDLSCS
jgi:hypothetical protein